VYWTKNRHGVNPPRPAFPPSLEAIATAGDSRRHAGTCLIGRGLRRCEVSVCSGRMFSAAPSEATEMNRLAAFPTLLNLLAGRIGTKEKRSKFNFFLSARHICQDVLFCHHPKHYLNRSEVSVNHQQFQMYCFYCCSWLCVPHKNTQLKI